MIKLTELDRHGLQPRDDVIASEVRQSRFSLQANNYGSA